jgi:hypothetical protein
VEVYRRALEGKNEHALLLGVTPELANIARETTALDNSEPMIAYIWPGDAPMRRAVLANWLAMPIRERRFSSVMGDGCLNTLAYSDYRTLFDQISKVLQPDARAVFRIFMTPDVCESLSALRSAAFSGEIESFHGFKWRLAMSITAERGTPDLRVTELHQTFERQYPDRAALAHATGWPIEDIDGIDAYAQNSAIYSFPRADEVLAAVPNAFPGAHFISSGQYELAECCPILIADFRP